MNAWFLLLLLFLVSAIAGFMLNWLKTAYKAFGVDFPWITGVLATVIGCAVGWLIYGGIGLLAGLFFGGIWWMIGRAYRKDQSVAPIADTNPTVAQTATTTGNNSPALNISAPSAIFNIQSNLSEADVRRIAAELQTLMRDQQTQKGSQLARVQGRTGSGFGAWGRWASMTYVSRGGEPTRRLESTGVTAPCG